jgi:AraC-like DNA-binding protein
MTAAVQNVRMVVAAAARRGVPPTRLLAAAGLDPQSLLAPDGRIAVEQALRVWRVAAELCGDPCFGVAMVDHLHPDYLGGLGLVLHGSATFGDALRWFARVFPVVNQHVALELIEDGAWVRVCFAVPSDVEVEHLRHPAEFLLAALLTIGRRTTGAALVPVAVALRHGAPAGPDAPAALAASGRVFGIMPCFDQPRYELVLERAALDTPSLAPDRELAELAARHVRRLHDELPPVETFSGRVRRVVLEELQSGEPTLSRLAARLRMSERTLQRRLGGEGTSVQALLDEARRRLSLRQLAESTRSIAEISYRLGFAEVGAFHRAFKRWTGSTPATYRKAHSAS